MGVFDNIFGKKQGSEKQSFDKSDSFVQSGKYNEPCSLCGGVGTDKKWAGKYWHVKCLRKGKKLAKGLL